MKSRINVLKVLFLCLALITITGHAYGQVPLTGSTTSGSDMSLSDAIGNRKVELECMTIDPNRNMIQLNLGHLELQTTPDGKSGELAASFQVVKAGIGNGELGERYVHAEANGGGFAVRLRIDQPRDMPIGTSFTTGELDAVREVPVKIVIRNELTGAEYPVFEMNQDQTLVKQLERICQRTDTRAKTTLPIPKYLQKRQAAKNVRSSYQRTTRQSAAPLLRRYRSIPGGVTLEGAGEGIVNVQSAKYDFATNSIVLNESLTYQCPVDRYDMRMILSSIARDDKMGISLAGGYLIYGRLTKSSRIALTLRLTDMLLGHIAFGGQHEREFGDYRFAHGYVPKRHQGPRISNVCVYFRFGSYEFRQIGSRYELESSDVAITLVPTKSDETADDGGALPDFDAIESGAISKQYEENVQHIVDNIDYYMQERLMRMANCYGEAAAFARALKRSKVDLGELAASM